jgi:hypothetical protein
MVSGDSEAVMDLGFAPPRQQLAEFDTSQDTELVRILGA